MSAAVTSALEKLSRVAAKLFVLFVLVGGLWALPSEAKALLALAFCAASFLHFVGRVIRHRHGGHIRVSFVSLALAFLSLGPLVVVSLTRGAVTPSFYSFVETVAVVLSVGLVLAIIRVEQQDDARKRKAKGLEELEAWYAEQRKRRR